MHRSHASVKHIQNIHRKIANGCCDKSHLSLKDIPHPKSLPVFGTRLDVFAAGGALRLHEYIDKRHKQLGPIFCENLNGTNLIFVSEPTLMKSLFMNLEGKHPRHVLPEPWILYEKLYGFKRGLFFMDGEEWLNNRRSMNQHLLRENSEKWFETPIKSTVSHYISELKTKLLDKNMKNDLESDLYKLSTDVIIAVLLGSNSPQESKHYKQLLSIYSGTVKQVFTTTSKLFGLPISLYQRLNLKAWNDFKESVDNTLTLSHKLVNEMLDQKSLTDGLIKKMSGDGISDEMIKRIVADFVIAAGDTTSFTTLWTLWLLSQNGNIVNELRVTDVSCLKSTLKESMRLYPVAPFITRILSKESFLGSFKLEEGTPIVASIYTAGRDEKYFSDALKFLPHRWERNDVRRKDLVHHTPAASLPFAMGARSCIGKKIAMIQMTEVIKQIVDNFDLKCTPQTKLVKPIMEMVLVPDKPIDITLSIRK